MVSKNWIGGSLGLVLMALFAQPVIAQQQPVTLTGDVKLERVVQDEKGVSHVELAEPKVIVPGDRLRFRTVYANTSAEPAQRFVVTNPVPPAVRLAPDADPELTVSVDGGRSWGTLAELTVTDANGIIRAATQEDVTHVRWTLAVVKPGESGSLEYPAIIR